MQLLIFILLYNDIKKTQNEISYKYIHVRTKKMKTKEKDKDGEEHREGKRK